MWNKEVSFILRCKEWVKSEANGRTIDGEERAFPKDQLWMRYPCSFKEQKDTQHSGGKSWGSIIKSLRGRQCRALGALGVTLKSLNFILKLLKDFQQGCNNIKFIILERLVWLLYSVGIWEGLRDVVQRSPSGCCRNLEKTCLPELGQ